jgi:transcriptional regulator with XRE-family HTH domain
LPRRRISGLTADEKGIGRRLREIREARDVTQVELAKKLGVDQTLVSSYERGRVRMHAAAVAEIARVLKTSTDEILGLKKAEHNGLIKSRGLRKRLASIDRLPPRDLRALLDTIDRFLKASGVQG